ncbi:MULTISPECIES: helix-turn-helix transcriptional regulator [unclassified Streptomyces]|uniref:helix-turn-helix transcriptional regulator n=1 Tax=unclassified Streptomyces TaxID=2593676 RepID=UPI00081B9885|nr:YafY family protein [Streptomyces sp. DvalAA-43]MYQ82402.1 WYL domain-containing protein [Streptomyces sp. SID4936]SCD36731.1 Predicted DNA-binding transcriptional regulator YafY, contains an HTH and WYL domains [Streptomyces sp. DvalAA-43]
MISTSARLLRLVSLLSTRSSWTNSELAERLYVTERTVRRDIANLRELGYAIDSDPGPWGGYRLSGGSSRLPPLSLDDEEALAVAVALREAALSGVLGTDQAALSALLKLQSLLPAHIADRLPELDAAFVHTPRSDERLVSPGVLLELATACRQGEHVRLSYRDRQDRATVRDIDPHRLVRTGHRWYLVALDVARGQWHTFRADRVTDAQPTGQSADLVDPPDAVLLVSHMLTSGYPLYATVRVPVPLNQALLLIPRNLGTHATLVTVGGSTPDELATYLLGLATPLHVLTPVSVRTALHTRIQTLLNANDPDAPGN